MNSKVTEECQPAPGQSYEIGVIGCLHVVQNVFAKEIRLTASVLSDFALLTELVVLQDSVCALDLHGMRPSGFCLIPYDLTEDTSWLFGSPQIIGWPEGSQRFPDRFHEALLAYNEFDYRGEMRRAGYTEITPFLEEVKFGQDKPEYEAIRRVTREGISALLALAPRCAKSTALATVASSPKVQQPELRSLGREFYKVLAKQYAVSTDLVARYDPAYKIAIPPLLAILLQRCRSTEDVPNQLQALRDEFGDLRKELGKLEEEVTAGASLKEQLEAIDMVERTRDALTKKIVGRKNLKSTLVKRVWGKLEELGIFKALGRDFTDLLRWDEQRVLLTRVHRFVDLWQLALDAEQHHRLLEKVFGSNNVDRSSLAKLKYLLRSRSPNRQKEG